MLLIHLLLSSVSVECTSCDSFLRLCRNYVYYHFIFPKISKRGVGIISSGEGGLENFSKINKRGDDYSVLESTFVMEIPREKNLRSTIVFSNVFENFHSRNNALWDLSKSASFRSRRFPTPRIPTVFRRAQKNTSQISRKFTKNRMTKRMGFYKSNLKSAKSTVFGRRVPKEWDFIFYQLYRFQKMPKIIRPK